MIHSDGAVHLHIFLSFFLFFFMGFFHWTSVVVYSLLWVEVPHNGAVPMFTAFVLLYCACEWVSVCSRELYTQIWTTLTKFRRSNFSYRCLVKYPQRVGLSLPIPLHQLRCFQWIRRGPVLPNFNILFHPPHPFLNDVFCNVSLVMHRDACTNTNVQW